jgi:hypothetical protein
MAPGCSHPRDLARDQRQMPLSQLAEAVRLAQRQTAVQRTGKAQGAGCQDPLATVLESREQQTVLWGLELPYLGLVEAALQLEAKDREQGPMAMPAARSDPGPLHRDSSGRPWRSPLGTCPQVVVGV